MYSQATNCKKWTAFYARPLFSLIILIILSACSDEKKFKAPDPVKDTTPPSIVSSLPDKSTSSNFEVDFDVEIVFSERMNIDSLSTEGGVKLFSGRKEQGSNQNNNEEVVLKPRAAILNFSEVPVTSQHLITGEDIQIPGTKMILRHASGRFALNTAYTVSIDEPARDLVEDDTETSEDERNFIEGANIIDFITQKGAWKTTQLLPNILIDVDVDVNENEIAVEQSKNQLTPLIVSNNSGDTFTLWRQEGLVSGINQLWFSRYLVNAKSWSLADSSKQVCLSGQITKCANAERIDSLDETNTLEYHAAVNDNGQIAVVWSKASQSGDFVAIRANLFDGESWLGVTEISSTGFAKTGHADSPQIAIDNLGNVVSIWREHDGPTSRIKTNIFKVGSNGEMGDGAWVEAPGFIDGNASVTTQTPKLAINTNGFAIAVWAQLQGNNLRIYSNRIRLNQSNDDDWQTPIQIDVIDSSSPEFGIGNSTMPQIAIDDNGDAMAVWLKHDGIRNNLWYNRFTGNWGQLATRLEGDRTGDADYPNIELSRDNKALVIWTQKNNTGNSTQLKSRFFEAAKGWGIEQNISSDNQIHKPVARFDREGNVNLIWQDAINVSSVETSFYSKLTGTWSQPESLAENANNASLAPLFEDGRFLSVWEQVEGGSYRLNFNRYSD